MTQEKQLRWVTVQIANVKKTLASVSRSNDNDYDVVYSNRKGAHMVENVTGDTTELRRERGIFILDCWVVPYEMTKTGVVEYIDTDGQKKSQPVGRKVKDFIRQAK